MTAPSPSGTLPPAARWLCEALLAARRQRRPVRVDAATEQAVPDLATAWALQQAQGEALGEWASGELPLHWKSGGPSLAEPLVHAPLLPSGVRRVADGGVADLSGLPFFQPAVEAELALRLGQSVSPAQAACLTVAQAADLVDAVAVSVEVVDSRWHDLSQASAWLKLADFQVHGALVLGPWQPWADGARRDWGQQRGHLRLGDAPPVPFQGSHSLGAPHALLPAWLRHLTRQGHTVPAGQVVTTGTWSGCVPLARGLHAEVAFEGFGGFALRV